MRLPKIELVNGMTERKCSLCNELVPKLSGNYKREQLINLGWNGVDDRVNGKKHYFCPKHSSDDIIKFMVKNKVGFK